MIKNKILNNENFCLVGVFDGHGSQGHYVSNLLKLFFSEYFIKSDLYKPENKNLIASINASMKSCFSDLNKIPNNINNYDKKSTYNINSSSNYNNYSHSLSLGATNSTRNKDINLNSGIYNNFTKKNYFIDNEINKLDDISEFNNIYYNKLIEDNYALIKNSFILAENSFSSSKYDMNCSGSTCICIFIIENYVICGNCGDSRAILVSNSKEKANSIIPLSFDHKPEVKEEAKRIIKNNGRVEKRSENGIKTGPLRVWLKNENYPGLSMTRSIGDLVAAKIGVISEPDIIEQKLDNNSKFIVVASDGVWEIMSNEEVASIVDKFYNNRDVESAADKLVEEAAKKWKKVMKI